MLDWLQYFFAWLGNARDSEHKDLRSERDALRGDLVAVMKAYQQLNLDLQQQIDSLRLDMEKLQDALRDERSEHKKSRDRLHKHEQEIFDLKAQVKLLMSER